MLLFMYSVLYCSVVLNNTQCTLYYFVITEGVLDPSLHTCSCHVAGLIRIN